MKYAVVIVGWNGADDTVACLASFLADSPEAVAIVVDNGSSDDSVPRALAELRRHDPSAWHVAGRDAATEATAATALGAGSGGVVVTGENLGFAAGCNLGLRIAAAAAIEVVVFLNNDTLVEGRALDRIVERLGAGDAFACLPMLVVHASDRIWNCGGIVYRFGLRRYRLGGQPRSAAAAAGEMRCSFFTGCCFAVRTHDFAARRGFCERFFFGEEDFELALWMKDRGFDAVCLPSAVVRHKVSASVDRAAGGRGSRKVFLHYLNRFIHLRLRFGPWRWALWLAFYLPYVALLLLRRRVVEPRRLPAFLGDLVARSRAMDGVGRADFEALMRGGGAAWQRP